MAYMDTGFKNDVTTRQTVPSTESMPTRSKYIEDETANSPNSKAQFKKGHPTIYRPKMCLHMM